jgi:hypothetical protein
MCGLHANSSGWYGNQVSNVQIPGPWGQSEPKEPSKNRDFYIDTFLTKCAPKEKNFTKFRIKAIKFPINFGAGLEGPLPEKKKRDISPIKY